MPWYRKPSMHKVIGKILTRRRLASKGSTKGKEAETRGHRVLNLVGPFAKPHGRRLSKPQQNSTYSGNPRFTLFLAVYLVFAALLSPNLCVNLGVSTLDFVVQPDAGAPPGQLFHGEGGDRQEDRHPHQLEEADQAGELP